MIFKGNRIFLLARRRCEQHEAEPRNAGICEGPIKKRVTQKKIMSLLLISFFQNDNKSFKHI